MSTTWDEFEEAGKKLHEADPTKYMGVFDTSNAHFMDYFFRAAGVKTYSVDGTENVSFDMQNDETKEVMERIQRMIDEGVQTADVIANGKRESIRQHAFINQIEVSRIGRVTKAGSAPPA